MTAGKRNLLILFGVLFVLFAALALLMPSNDFYLERHGARNVTGEPTALLWVIRSIYIIPIAVWFGVWLLMGLFAAFYSCIKPARGFVIFCAAASPVMLLLYVYFSVGFIRMSTMPPMPLSVSLYILDDPWIISAWMALAAVFGHVAVTHMREIRRHAI